MKNITTIAVLLLGLTYTSQVAALSQGSVKLLCKGNLEKNTDQTKKSNPLVLDITFNSTDATVEVNDYWGCMADFGIFQTDKKPLCFGVLPVKVSDGEISYSAASESNDYAGNSSFILNRYTGTFSISGSAMSKPSSGANWRFIMAFGKLQCVNPEKMF